jgi:hypothetical protein
MIKMFLKHYIITLQKLNNFQLYVMSLHTITEYILIWISLTEEKNAL